MGGSGTGRYREHEQIHPEGGAEDSLQRRPLPFQGKKKKRKVMERILEKAKRIWAPREKFSSLRGA